MNQDMEVRVSQTSTEWYTPLSYIKLVKEVLGEIDLDPASCKISQSYIKANDFITKSENALTKNWCSNTVFFKSSLW